MTDPELVDAAEKVIVKYGYMSIEKMAVAVVEALQPIIYEHLSIHSPLRTAYLDMRHSWWECSNLLEYIEEHYPDVLREAINGQGTTDPTG